VRNSSSLKRLDIDQKDFTLQIRHACLYLVSVHKTALTLRKKDSKIFYIERVHSAWNERILFRTSFIFYVLSKVEIIICY